MRPVSGSAEWYWCCDYASGDLYEAEELYQDGHPIKQNRCYSSTIPTGAPWSLSSPTRGSILALPALKTEDCKS